MTRLIDREPVPVQDGWLEDRRFPRSAGLDPELTARQIMWNRIDDSRIMYLTTDREIIEEILRTVVSLPVEVDEDDIVDAEILTIDEGLVVQLDNQRWQIVNQPLIRFAQVIASATGVRMRFVQHHSNVQIPQENGACCRYMHG